MFIILSGCAFASASGILYGLRSVNRLELVGTYACDSKAARETLVLCPDGTFLQRAALKYNSDVLVAYGTWDYDVADQYIDFHHGFLVTTQDDLGQPMKAPGDISSPVVRGWFGTPRIGSGEHEQTPIYWRQHLR
jgi:hypothetical protein